MKNEDGSDNANDTEGSVPPSAPETEGGKQKRKTRRQPQKSNNQHKKSFGRSWRAASATTKVGIYIGGVAAAATVGYLLIFTWQAWHMRPIPLVVNSRAPELLQPLTCDQSKGQLNTGNMRVFVKNIGNGRAFNVLPYFSPMKVIPEVKTGQKLVDDPPSPHCDLALKIPEMAFNLAPGEEKYTEIRQAVMTIPNLPLGSTVQLYYTACVYYTDEYGSNHGTCDSYRLNFPSNNPLDRLSGSPTFVCDGTPKSGKFFGNITGRCQQ